jgi:hypothetical protein
MSEESYNPYTPAKAVQPDEGRQSKPHSLSIRTEAWRGAKFGARITAIAVGSIVGLLYIAGFCMLIYLTIVTEGRVLQRMTLFETVKGLGGGIFGVLLASFYGGVAGAVIMTLATLVRRRKSKASSP